MSPDPSQRHPQWHPNRHLRALTAAVLAVLMLHGLLLHGTLNLDLPSSKAATPSSAAIALQTRAVSLAPGVAAPETRDVPSAPAQNSPRHPLDPPAAPPQRTSPRDPAARTARTEQGPPDEPNRTATAPDPAPDPAPVTAPLTTLAPSAQAGSSDALGTSDSEFMGDNDKQSPAQPAPLYSAAPAPPVSLVYQWRRGPQQGQARLRWQPQTLATSQGSNALTYRLQLQFEASGMAGNGWSSAGRVEAHGLAPDRYSEWRRSREVRATNFLRDSQSLSFSAQSAVLPLPQGLQDRSSWLIQLGAVLQANPELAEVGQQVTLPVVGTRGQPEAWTFTVTQRAELQTPAGPVAGALQLLREPRRPYDTRVTVWLDPAHHHLPLDLQLVVHGVGEVQRWQLLSLQWE